MARSEAHESRAVHITQEDVRRLCEFLYRRTDFHLPTASGTSSIAVSQSESPLRNRRHFRRILPSCGPMPSMRSNIWSTPR